MATSKPKVDEISAISAVDQALSALDDAEKARVLKWANDKFGNHTNPPPANRSPLAVPKSDPALTSEGESLGDFYSRITATTSSERALAVAYWIQEIRGDGDFDSQSVNTELKNLGHGVSNITWSLEQLKARKPQLVIQTQKSGKTKQARKRFKITAAGKQEVTRMLRGEAAPQ